MRFVTIARFALFLVASIGMVILSGGCSSSETRSTQTIVQHNQNDLRALANDPKMSPQAKQAMAEAMKQHMPADVKVAMGKQEAIQAKQQNANIDRINADPNLSAEEKQKFIAQERAAQ